MYAEFVDLALYLDLLIDYWAALLALIDLGSKFEFTIGGMLHHIVDATTSRGGFRTQSRGGLGAYAAQGRYWSFVSEAETYIHGCPLVAVGFVSLPYLHYRISISQDQACSLAGLPVPMLHEFLTSVCGLLP